MKKIEPISFADAKKLTPAEMNAIHISTGQHSDADEDSKADDVSEAAHQRQRRQP